MNKGARIWLIIWGVFATIFIISCLTFCLVCGLDEDRCCVPMRWCPPVRWLWMGAWRMWEGTRKMGWVSVRAVQREWEGFRTRLRRRDDIEANDLMMKEKIQVASGASSIFSSTTLMSGSGYSASTVC